MHLILQSSGRSRSDCCNLIVSQLLRLRKRFRESFANFFVGNGAEVMQRGQNKRLCSGESAVDKAIESVLQIPEGESEKEGTHMDRIYLDNADDDRRFAARDGGNASLLYAGVRQPVLHSFYGAGCEKSGRARTAAGRVGIGVQRAGNLFHRGRIGERQLGAQGRGVCASGEGEAYHHHAD